MKCKECLFEFDKPKNGFKVYQETALPGEVWPLCPHCNKDIPTKENRRATKKDYQRLNR
jgi:hypothetical protein